MLTDEMRGIAQRIADEYGTCVYGVLMLASAKGPTCWRGCVPIAHDYRPKYGKTGNRSVTERSGHHVVDEYEYAFDFL